MEGEGIRGSRVHGAAAPEPLQEIVLQAELHDMERDGVPGRGRAACINGDVHVGHGDATVRLWKRDEWGR